MEENVTTSVMGKAQGMFLLAQLHMDSLANKSNRNAILKTLEKLPKGFEGTYDDAMKRINQQSEERKEMAYRVLSWISYAFRSLSIVELQHAVAIKEDMTEMDEYDLDDDEFLISVCVGLVTVSGESRQVGLVHYTTQEYLQSIRDLDKSQFLSPADLAISSLVYLHLAHAGLLQADPFTEYAAQGWGEHSRGIDNHPIIMKYAVGLL